MTVTSGILVGVTTVTPRRSFILPEADEEFLYANYPGWETILQGATPWLLLKEFPIPLGYNCGQAQAAIQIPSGHPNAPLDMVYFLPGLVRADGKPIRTITQLSIDGQIWQRWSRHYRWRPCIDDLVTHIERIKSWLEDELKR